jgi:hypothetical protein
MRILVIAILLAGVSLAWGQEKGKSLTPHEVSTEYSPHHYFYTGLLNEENTNTVTVAYIYSWKLKNNWSLGCGGGFEFFSQAEAMPLIAEIKKQFPQKSLPFFLFLRLGYTIGTLKDSTGYGFGGPMMHLGFNTGIKLSQNSGLIFEIGYKLQNGTRRLLQTFYYEDDGYTYFYFREVTKRLNYDFITFSVGVNF